MTFHIKGAKRIVMDRKKQQEADDKEQAARFIEAAKKIEELLSKKDFEGVFDKIAKKKRASKAQS